MLVTPDKRGNATNDLSGARWLDARQRSGTDCRRGQLGVRFARNELRVHSDGGSCTALPKASALSEETARGFTTHLIDATALAKQGSPAFADMPNV
jgi:hypothetical protein